MVLRTKDTLQEKQENATTVGAQGYKDEQKETRIPGRGVTNCHYDMRVGHKDRFRN